MRPRWREFGFGKKGVAQGQALGRIRSKFGRKRRIWGRKARATPPRPETRPFLANSALRHLLAFGPVGPGGESRRKPEEAGPAYEANTTSDVFARFQALGATFGPGIRRPGPSRRLCYPLGSPPRAVPPAKPDNFHAAPSLASLPGKCAHSQSQNHRAKGEFFSCASARLWSRE